jgi:hypothetical protein
MFALAIVALILVLGVGYAVVSSVTLTIEGTGAAKSEKLKVVYDGVNTNSGAKVTAQTAADDSKAATFTVEDMVLNEAQYAEFEIKNKETDVNATVKVPTVSWTNTDYFSVVVQYDGTDWTADQTLNAQATAKVKVIVTLIKTPVVEANNSTTINISYDAEPIA